jgi:hypothetical protein
MAKNNGSAFQLNQANSQMSPLPEERIQRLVDNPYTSSLPEDYAWKPAQVDAQIREDRSKLKKAFKAGRI